MKIVRMRIGLVLSKTPGYSETFFNSKIKGLQDRGMDVVLYCQSKTKGFEGIPVVLAPKVTSNPFLQLGCFIKEYFLLIPHLPATLRYIQLERKEGTRFAQLFKQLYLNAHLLKAKLDWLQFGFATQALGSETVAKAIGAKMAVSFRGFDINVYPVKHPGCYLKLWKHVDKVHSISQYLLHKAIGMGLSKKTAATIITPAVNLATMPVPTVDAPSERIKIVTIARLSWIKGLDTALKAMLLLKKQGVKFTYYIIGDGDTNYRERYKFMVYELGITKEVVFCGKLTHQETLGHLSTATMYVQPSLNEGFCNAVLEAQALGKLTIATNAGGLPENIVDGKTGWLFDTGSSESLVATITKIIGLSVERRTEVSKNAKMRVKNAFSIAKQKEEFIAFYSK